MSFFFKKNKIKFSNLKYKDKIDKKENKTKNKFFSSLKTFFTFFINFFSKIVKKTFVLSIQYNLILRWFIIFAFFASVGTGIGILFSPIGDKLISANFSNSFNRYFTNSSTLYIDYFDKTNVNNNNVKYDTVKNNVSQGISFLLETKSIYKEKFHWSTDQLTFSDAGTKKIDGFKKHIIAINGPSEFIQFIDDYSSFLSGSQYITVTDQWGNGFKQPNNDTKNFVPCDPNELLKSAATGNPDGKVVGWNSFKTLNKNVTDTSIFKDPSQNYNSFTLSLSVSDTTLLSNLVKFIWQHEKQPYDPKTNPWGYFNDNNFSTKAKTLTPKTGISDENDLQKSHRNYLLFWLGSPTSFLPGGKWSSMGFRGTLFSNLDSFEDNNDLLLKSFDSNVLSANIDQSKILNPYINKKSNSSKLNYLYNPLAFNNKMYSDNQMTASNAFKEAYDFVKNDSYKKYVNPNNFLDPNSFDSSNNSAFGLIGAFSIDSFAPYFDYNENYKGSWSSYLTKQKWNLLNDPKNYDWHLFDDNDANKNSKDSKAKEKYDNQKVKNPFKSFNAGSFDFKTDLNTNEYPVNVNNILPIYLYPTNVNINVFNNNLKQLFDSAVQTYVPNINLTTVNGPLILDISQLIYVFVTLSIFLILIFIWLIAKYKWLSVILLFSFLTFNLIFFVFFFLANWTFQPIILIVYLISIILYIIFSIKNIDQVQGIIKGIIYSNVLFMDKKIWRTYHKNFYKDIALLWLTFLCLYLGFNFYYQLFQPIIIIWLFAWFCSAILIFLVCKFIITTIILSKHKDLYYQIYPSIVRKKRKKLIVIKNKKND